MEDTKIQFKTAKLAKEAGFDEPCKWHYTQNKPNKVPQLFSVYPIEALNTWNGRFSAPTQSLLQRWFREVHKIHIEIGWMRVNPFYPSRTNYYFASIDFLNDRDRQGLTTLGDDHKTYEEAMEDGLIMALNLIQK